MEFRKNDLVTLEIEDCGIDGEGIGKADGFTVFVKDAVIGDTVTAKIIKAKKNYGYGRLMEVLKPSPYRVEPKCEFARQCGGCQLQALSYDQQLVFKTNKVKGHLERIGGFTDIPMEPIIGMDELFHYRNKAQFPVGRNKEGKIVTGFYAGRTHNIIENRDCALGVAENKEVLDRVIAHMEKYGIEPYNEATGKGLVRHVLIRYGYFTKEVMVCLILNGNKIPEEASQYIFEPFYQMEKKEAPKNGVGIGLSLARSLASLHKGTLTLDTTREKDNVFILTIPLNKEGISLENSKAVQKDIVELDEETSVETDMHGYTLLLVEDNESMLAFISERLCECFTVETAKNGAEAIEILRSSHVDLIISDIMMPVMNGYQLCKEIKSDLELSHIPVIFLTAKNDIDSKINGLKYGAKAYVEKPFSFGYLKEQILSLLNNRRREREAFSKRPFFSVDNMQMNKADEEFMNKVIRIIEDNITDDNFGVEKMADILCMSRSSLLRKIKTIFNLSPLDFIRLIRLKKAAEYIQEGKYRIGDICYMVGINSPSYFSKLFLKQFGMTPKDFEKQYQSGKQIIITQEIKNVEAGEGTK